MDKPANPRKRRNEEMSVIGFSVKEAKDLYSDLRKFCYKDVFRACFYEHGERIEMEYVWKKDPRMEVFDDLARFVYRMYLANQLSYNLNYEGKSGEWKIENPQDLDVGVAKRTDKEIYQELSSWEYNLFTNAGRCFFCKEDIETLERVKKYILERIADPFNQNCGIPGETD